MEIVRKWLMRVQPTHVQLPRHRQVKVQTAGQLCALAWHAKQIKPEIK